MALNGAQAIDIEHDNRGHGLSKFTLNEEGKKIFPELSSRDTCYVIYYEGPVFIPSAPDSIRYTLLATMQSDVHKEGNAPAGMRKQTGTIGNIGCTSFFPSKNLGYYGDGRALMADDDELAEKIRMIANHGQKIKYHHAILRCNSRLDTLQAAILDVKLKYLDEYSRTHYRAALYYTQQLKGIEGIITPEEMPYSTHVYHQYTLKVRNGKRDALKKFLEEAGIPAMIYYPLLLQQQEAFKTIARAAENLDTAEKLAYSVLSLPIHTEITRE